MDIGIKSIRYASTANPTAASSALSIARASLFLAQFAAGVLATLLITACGFALHINLSTAGLLYLLLIVLFSVHCGFWQASSISLAAVLCQNFFFAPPIFSFYVADRKNAIAIVIFEVTALLVSRVSSSEKANALEKERHQHKLERLYAVTRGALLLDLHDSPEQQMAHLILREFKPEAIAIMNAADGTIHSAGHWPFPPRPIAAHVIETNSHLDQSIPRLYVRPVMLGQETLGALLILGHTSPLTVDSLASLIALTLDRHRAFINEGIAQAAHQTEQLRTTVLDGLAHAFKTPLTIIRAASSGLIELGHLDKLQGQLVEVIDEQSQRLDELTTRLLQTARVDRTNICLQIEKVSVQALLEDVVQEALEDRSGHGEEALLPAIHVTCDRDLRIVADHDMVASTLKELLENATKYSTPGTPIRVSASEADAELLISVHNHGPVIRMEDRERIFECFYRSTDHSHYAPGTGIGLSVARRVTEVHGGHIWVISEEEQGTTFVFSLPLYPQDTINSIRGVNDGDETVDRR